MRKLFDAQLARYPRKTCICNPTQNIQLSHIAFILHQPTCVFVAKDAK